MTLTIPIQSHYQMELYTVLEKLIDAVRLRPKDFSLAERQKLKLLWYEIGVYCDQTIVPPSPYLPDEVVQGMPSPSGQAEQPQNSNPVSP